MMQSVILSSGSPRTHTPTPGGIPPFSHYSAGGIVLPDTLSEARILASRIIDVWAIEGHSVDAWVVKLSNPSNRDGHGNPATWGVRTDLVNGMPSGLGRAAWERKYGRGI
jgi:hypothetical protein